MALRHVSVVAKCMGFDLGSDTLSAVAFVDATLQLDMPSDGYGSVLPFNGAAAAIVAVPRLPRGAAWEWHAHMGKQCSIEQVAASQAGDGCTTANGCLATSVAEHGCITAATLFLTIAGSDRELVNTAMQLRAKIPRAQHVMMTLWLVDPSDAKQWNLAAAINESLRQSGLGGVALVLPCRAVIRAADHASYDGLLLMQSHTI